MIKIGVFTTDFNIRQVALWRLMNADSRFKVKIYLFTYDSNPLVSELKNYKQIFKKLDYDVIPAKRGKIRLPHKFFSAERLNVAVIYDYWYRFERQIVKNAAKHNYKVILHTMIERIIDLQGKNEPIFSNLHLKWCFNNIDAFCLLGYSAKWRMQALGIPEEKLFLAPNVVDGSHIRAQKKLYNRDQIREELDIDSSEIVFLFYHDWINEKHAHELMHAMSMLKDYPQISLIFLGEETKKQKIYDLLHDDFKGRLIVAGKCNLDKSGYYFCASDVFVMPASKYYWGDMANLAMQWGLPTIINSACECGGEFVIDGYTGYSFYDNDVEALVRYMRKFITYPELIERMRTATINQIQNYTVQTSKEGFEDAVNYLMKKD